MSVVEIVKWKAMPNASDKVIIEAVNNMIPDLKGLPGFLSQALYKQNDGQWIDIYYWQNAEDAHRSNDLMAAKDSLKRLLVLIELKSVSLEILEPMQDSTSSLGSQV